MRKTLVLILFLIFNLSLVLATFSYYDPVSDVATNWNDGTGLTFAEIDEGVRQPTTAGMTADNVADSTQGAGGISEFNFNTVTETPNNMTLWVYTQTGGSCNYDFFLQQAGASRCTTSITSGTAVGWQSCSWTSPTGDYSAITVELSDVTKSGGGHSDCTVHEAYLEVDYTINNVPTLGNITLSPYTIKGGNTLTIYANSTDHGLNDTDSGATLNLYCDTTNTPTAANTDCTGGTTSDSTDPYDLTCTFATATTDLNNTVYCRAYDSTSYSNVTNTTYVTDSTPPSTSIVSVAYDSAASYFDTANDGRTDILVDGEASMACRWGTSDAAYSSMSNSCTISGTQGNCSVNDVASQGVYNRYVACQDTLTNEQNSTLNLDIGFTLDYTAPTTSDNSVTSVQAPNYSVTITELDNVDSDPTTFYCKDTTGSCNPNIAIDDGQPVVFTELNRGRYYLRYNSSDDAGNSQTAQNKTININQLPIFETALDDAVIVNGSTVINITTNSSDPDVGQAMNMYVCNSTSITSGGCAGKNYCNATGTGNLTCVFNAEDDSVNHTWYASIYDALNEGATANPESGIYTTDNTAPVISVASPTNITYTQDSVAATINLDE